MTVTIRWGIVEERGKLEDLQRRSSLAVEQYRADLLAHPEAVHLPVSQLADKRVRVAEIEAQIVGFSVLLSRTDQIFELGGLFVEPERWLNGIGRALIGDAVTNVAATGGVVLEVVANPVARVFYEKLGFKKWAPTNTQFGPALLMRLPINE
jgi:GNAT superfamily N-acetyltransferase